MIRPYLFILFVAFALCSPWGANSSHAQNLVKQWDHRFGGTSDELLSSFQQTSDGGYILGGTSFSGIGGDKTQASQGDLDYWVVKINSLGVKQWDKRFGGTLEEDLTVVRQTIDGGYILGGYSNSPNNGDKSQNTRGNFDYWIVKIDASGNKQWDKRFGGSAIDYLFDCRQTSDKGYILGGYSYSGKTGDRSQASWGMADYWIVKVDSLGAYQWDQRYGGTNEDQLFSLQQTKDGGYILGGHSASDVGGDKTQPTWGGFEDYWLVKTDANGVKQWDKRYGSMASDYLKSVQQTIDGGYVMGGLSYGVSASADKTQASHGNYDFWVVKTDVSGNIVWNRSVGGAGKEDNFGNIMQAADGGFLLGGASYSAVSGDKSELNVGAEQSWMFKMDATGTKELDKTALTWGTDQYGYAIETKDHCFAIANSTLATNGWDKTEPNWDPSNTYHDYWIVTYCDTAHSIPTAHFAASDSTLCAESGSCIDFYDYSTGNPSSWNWTFSGGSPDTSTQKNPTTICYYNPGTFAVTLVVNNSNGKDSLVTKLIEVGTTPLLPSLTRSHDTLFCSHEFTYLWYKNGVVIPGAVDSFFVIKGDATYSVFISDKYSCTRFSNGYLITSINPMDEEEAVNVYPNPAKSQFTVSGLEFTVNTSLEIYNLLGEKVYFLKPETVNGKPETVVDVANLARGIYILKISGEHEAVFRKIVIE